MLDRSWSRLFLLAVFCCVFAAPDICHAELIARWTFDSGFSDSSGNGLHGTANNGSRAGVSDAGRSTGVLELDGTDDYVSVADNNLLDLGGQFTITSWFKTNSPSANGAQHLVRKMGNGNDNSEIYYTRLDPGGSPLKFNVTGTGDDRVNAAADSTFNSSSWYFMAATFDSQSNQQQLFLDDLDNPAASATATISGPEATNGELRIGRGAPNGYFNGRLDDLRIYSSVLSITELETVAAGGMIDFTPTFLAGDFNNDRVVDLGDLDTIQAGFGTLFVAGDLEVWQVHYQGPLTQQARAFIASVTAVPEPSFTLLLFVFFGTILGMRYRKAVVRSGEAAQEAAQIVRATSPCVLAVKPANVIAGLAVLVSMGTLGSTVCAQAAKPNIVFIVSDDHHWEDYSYTGANEFVNTANIDRLAREGLAFNRGYVPMSLCRPSLVTMLTGKYGVQHGVYGNDPNTRKTESDFSAGYPNSVDNRMIRRNIQHEATLPKMLAEAGYVSQQTGKLWEGNYRRSGFTEGFVQDNHRHQDTIAIGRPGGGMSSDVSEVTDFIDRAVANDDPFFAFYAPLLPHTPHNPHVDYRARYNTFVANGDITTHEANYYAQIDALDDSIGRIRSHIESKTDGNGNSVDDNTIYVYAADNGWEQDPSREGEIGGRGKREPDESGIRTPILISWKDQIMDARTLEAKLADTSLASTIDIAPTLLAAAGLDPTAQMEGVNLTTHRREKVFGDIYAHDQIVNSENNGTGDWRVGNPEQNLNSRWMIEGEWKLIVPASGSAELYNLADDPEGRTNLANDSANDGRVAQMSQEVDDWYATNRPTTIYSHEFNGSASSIDGQSPDVADANVSGNTWKVGPQNISDSGEITGRTSAVLPFTPEDGKRYELRTGLSPVDTNNSLAWLSFGFQEGTEASIDPTQHGVAYARVRSDASLDDLVLHASADGEPDGGTDWDSSGIFSTDELEYFGDEATLMLVLDTGDNDLTLDGDQWLIDLVVNGTSVYEFVFAEGNPDIGGITLGSYSLPGEPSLAGLVDYLQLIEVPTTTYRIGAPIAIPEPNSMVLMLLVGSVMVGRRRRI